MSKHSPWIAWAIRPPENASGCVEAMQIDLNPHSTPVGHFRLSHVHLQDESRWAHHSGEKWVYGQYHYWRWLGPPIPSVKEQDQAILIWRFRESPGELRAMSPHGGDEDWLALVPKDLADEWISWLESGSAFGCCDVSEQKLPDGRGVKIGAHA